VTFENFHEDSLEWCENFSYAHTSSMHQHFNLALFMDCCQRKLCKVMKLQKCMLQCQTYLWYGWWNEPQSFSYTPIHISNK